ncbi:MAG: MFS transporter [candidate division NC10 bacterium]
MLSYGAQVTFLPIHAKTQDVNPGLFFLVFALAITAVRGYAGRFSDRMGRPAVAVVGLALTAGALAVQALTRGAASLMAAGALYGLGFGAATTALMAWCMDVVDAANRGRAMATFLTAAGAALAGASLVLLRRRRYAAG